MTYGFINPLDYVPMMYNTQQEAENAARLYLGKEDIFAEETTSIRIFRHEFVSIVKPEGDLDKSPSPEGVTPEPQIPTTPISPSLNKQWGIPDIKESPDTVLGDGK